jgi:hypothetical protein
MCLGTKNPKLLRAGTTINVFGCLAGDRNNKADEVVMINALRSGRIAALVIDKGDDPWT